MPCTYQQYISLTDTISVSHLLGKMLCTGSQISQEHKAYAVIQEVWLCQRVPKWKSIE